MKSMVEGDVVLGGDVEYEKMRRRRNADIYQHIISIRCSDEEGQTTWT